MTLRTSLVIDGDAAGARQATDQAVAGLGQLEGASEQAAHAASQAMLRFQQQATRQAAQIRQGVLFQLNDIGVSLASGMNPLMVALQQGSQLATGPGGLGAALKETGNIAVGLATRFWPIGAAVAAATAGIVGMQDAINSAGSSVQVSFGDVAMGTLQTFGDYIWDAIGPAVTAISGWFANAWNSSWPVIKNFGNTLIGTFAGAFDAMKAVWSTLPAVLGDIVYSAANGVLDGINWLINAAIDKFNDLRRMVNMDDLNHVAPFRLDNPFAGAAGDAAGKMGSAFQNAMGTDYLGGFFSDVAANARENATKRLADEASKGKSKQQAAALNEVTKAIEQQRTAWNDLADAGSSAFDRLSESILQGGKDIGQVFRDIAGDFAKLSFDMAITNPLKNFAFGGNATTFGGNWLSGALGSFGGMGGLKSLPGLGGLTGTVKSYAGGGFTGRGARAGRMDGSGGFPCCTRRRPWWIIMRLEAGAAAR
jgi:hypothetical protein